MSVVVLGMDMPEDCDSCFVPAWHCNLWLRVDVGSRHEDCPLRSLPEKHGDLIDRDALLSAEWDWRDAEEAIQNATAIVEAEGENDG